MDLDVRRMSSTAIVAIGVWMALAALLFRHHELHAVNSFIVGAGFVALGLVARSARFSFVAFSSALALATWLFFSPWVLRGSTAWVVVNQLVVSALAFGFAGAPLAAPVRRTA